MESEQTRREQRRARREQWKARLERQQQLQKAHRQKRETFDQIVSADGKGMQESQLSLLREARC
jgi:hypothetical protein